MRIIQNLIDLTPFYITAFWGLVFIFSPIRKNPARFGLGIFMLMTSVVYFTHAIYFEGDYETYLNIDWIYALAGLSVYPMYYLYIRLMTRDDHFKYTYLWHLLPAVLVALLLNIFAGYASPLEKGIYINSVLLHNRWPTGEVTHILRLMSATYFFSRLIFSLQTVLYLIFGLLLIKKYNKRIANFYSNVEGKQLVYVELITITLIIASFSSFILNFLGRNYFVENHILYIPSMVLSLLFFIMGWLGNKQDVSFIDVLYDEDEVYFSHPNENKEVLKEKLLFFMDTEQLFLDANLRITTLSSKLFTNRTYLSNLINTEFQMTFTDFVNKYRVEYAKSLMEDDYHRKYSLIHFSEKSGFGSVSSFNRAFKQYEGISAGAFHLKLRKSAS